MEIRTGTLTFTRGRGNGPRSQSQFFNFNNSVRQAIAGLTGTNFGFSPRDDHHLGLVNVRLATSIDDDVVTVEGILGVRDWSNDWDDDYEGTVQFTLLVELETGSAPSNLSITGVECNQTIQFFRTALAPPNARLDNSVALIAGKNTAVRVFVDTQNDPTRPTIASVAGTLEFRVSGGGGWLPATSLNGPNPPIADSAIRRTNASDTLNFLIPGSFCNGLVQYRVRVFDPARQNEPGFFTGLSQGTLEFTPVAPLVIHGVAVNFTGTPNVAAPDFAALLSTLTFVRKNYPVGTVSISGFDTIDYNGNFASSSGGGCGEGWNGLLSRLREMQGDSADVYFGLVPTGVPSSARGCGGGDGRVAAGLVNLGDTAAQEIAHAFGRSHACGQAPLDPNYPVYGTLPMASIGEVGIDDSGNVKDPALVLDFMAQATCSTNRWVSPYTYESLRQVFPPVPSSPDVRARAGSLPSPAKEPPSEHLFLKFRTYRNGRIEVFPSFHYMSSPLVKAGEATPYGIELRDCQDKVVQAQRVLLTDPTQDLDSAALDFFKPIPFPAEASRLVFTCGGTGDCGQREILSVGIPKDAPKVHILSPHSSKQLTGRVKVSWQAEYEKEPLHYLLRFSNDGGRTWRAVAPMLPVKEYVVDLDTLPGGDSCYFQVLATEGIRTGSARSDSFSVPRRPAQTVVQRIGPDANVYPGQTITFVGEALSAEGGVANTEDLRWSSDVAGNFAVGQEARYTPRRPGHHRIRLTAPDRCGGECYAEVELDVTKFTRHTHTSEDDPAHTSKDHESGKIPYRRKGEHHHGN